MQIYRKILEKFLKDDVKFIKIVKFIKKIIHMLN
jgi:hypothetical protein